MYPQKLLITGQIVIFSTANQPKTSPKSRFLFHENFSPRNICGDVVKLFFWVSFYYILKKTKAFHFKSKAFLFYSDKFPKNQKLFFFNQKLFFFPMTRFLQIKSFSFSYNKIFTNQKLLFFNQISFFWWFLHHSHTFLTPWHISSPYCAQINYCMQAIITRS